VGTTGIIFNEKNEILLFKHTYRSHSWSLPGGYLKAGEHPREGLEREIKEESGFVVSMDESLKTRTDRDFARLDLCYTGVLIGGEFTPTHEVSEYGFFSQENLPLLRKNQIFLIDEALKEKVT
jgi:ADP-ribose pyrophosphatase YjhB (NUDIX family)